MISTQLFVYGTLRHDQPEHAKYCRGVSGWRPARVRGRLAMTPSGYRLLVVPAALLLSATTDAREDETRRRSLPAAAVTAGASGPFGWIEGELLAFRDAVEAWPPLDAWEDFTPGRSGCYARLVLPVEYCDAGGRWHCDTAWVYATTRAPEHPEGLAH